LHQTIIVQGISHRDIPGLPDAAAPLGAPARLDMFPQQGGDEDLG
jgi:hypothetical protein